MSPLQEHCRERIPYIVATLHSILYLVYAYPIYYIESLHRGLTKIPGRYRLSSVELRGEQDMWTDYRAKEVLKRVTLEVAEAFHMEIGIPAGEVKLIVERHFTSEGAYGFAGFMKINAIKEVRDMHMDIPYLKIGLREAKDMVETIYREGEEAGNYHASIPAPHIPPVDFPSGNHIATADTLPF